MGCKYSWVPMGTHRYLRDSDPWWVTHKAQVLDPRIWVTWVVKLVRIQVNVIACRILMSTDPSNSQVHSCSALPCDDPVSMSFNWFGWFISSKVELKFTEVLLWNELLCRRYFYQRVVTKSGWSWSWSWSLDGVTVKRQFGFSSCAVPSRSFFHLNLWGVG